MVSFRKNFRRYYDLRERVLPDWDDSNALSLDNARKAILLKAVSALGIAREDWVAPYYHFLKTGLPQLLEELVEEEKLERGWVEGWEKPVYVHPGRIALVEAAMKGDLIPSHTTLLSPFDPLVSDRDRTLALFDFDYTMESYKPVKDRKYGYFCLPILHQGQLVGRLDPKAHRKQKRMEIKNLYLEQEVTIEPALIKSLKTALTDFTVWHEMERMDISTTHPPELREELL